MFTVLIADDYNINRLLIKELLRNNDFNIIESENGKDVIEKFTSYKIDLIFMDIQMPIMNGIESTKYIREELKSDIPIIAVTAYNTNELDNGKFFNDILSKPINNSIIRRIIEKYLK